MGKTNSSKKPKPAVTGREQQNGTNSNGDPYKDKNETSAELDELAARLRRLETTNSNKNSDVYKFALFFIMGVVMTVFLYPHASKTVESFNNNQQAIKYERSSSKADIDSFVDVDEKSFENTGDADKSTKPNESMSVNNVPIEVSVADNVNQGESKSDKETISEQNGDNSVVVEEDDKQINEKEDPLIGESQSEEEQKKDEQKLDSINERTERIELLNLDGDTGDLPIRFVDENNNEMQDTKLRKKEQTDKKTKDKALKSKKTTNSKGKTKTKKKLKNKEDTDQKDTTDSSKLPDEVRNFKATYQKNIQPKKIFADGRRIPPMELLAQKPNNSSVKVWLFEEFLSEAECDGLMRVHNKHVEEQSRKNAILCFDSITTLRKHLQNVGKQDVRVSPRDFTEGTTCVNESFSGQLKTWLKGNWSYSTAFYPGESRFASIFEQRVQQAMGLKPENGGKFQITSYPLGIGYKSHTDCTEDSTDKRDRMATVLVYLDTVKEGGETDFPELGVWVRPRKARALLWNNMNEDGECEPLSIHQANKVIDGRKIILQRWYYYKSFYSLGKRPPEPPLPRREPGQPRVSCDEYEHGSCRWYDEWNFEHMLEYERQKYNLI